VVRRVMYKKTCSWGRTSERVQGELARCWENH
jgi:hypothetical protein